MDQLAEARAVSAAAGPIAGTLGERYLIEIRGIPAPAEGWPGCIRWHAGKRAVIFIATNAEGEVERVQEVHLRPDGQNKRRSDGKKLKLTRGPVTDGAAVRLPGIGDNGLDAFEGPENGVTAWRATGRATMIWLGLGVLTQVQLAPGRSHIIGRDDDKARSLRRSLAREGPRRLAARPASGVPSPHPGPSAATRR